MPYAVVDGIVVYTTTSSARVSQQHVLGPETGLYADPQSLPGLAKDNGVRHLALWPRSSPPDFIFASEGRVVGVEMKRPADFVASWKARRLARQIRSLRRECQIVAVMARGGLPPLDAFERVGLDMYPRFLRELTELQVAGVLLVVVEDDEGGVLRGLGILRAALAGASPAALAGTDRHPKRPAEAGGWFLRNIRGVGPVLAQRLHEEYGSTGAALTKVEEWHRLGASKRVVERTREALG